MKSNPRHRLVKSILERHSCRNFTGGPIDEQDLELLVECMRQAPSAGNRQPWHVFTVRERILKEKLAQAAYGQTFVARAPVVFVICCVPARSASRYGYRGEALYAIQDTAAMAENLLLAAEALGYGACWVGAFDEVRASQALSLDSDRRVVAIIPVGPGEKSSSPPGRIPASEIVTNID